MSDVVEQAPTEQQIVDRARRHRFISRVTMFCLATTAVFAALSGLGWFVAGPVVDLYMRSAASLALTAVGAYVTGSVIDYNGGFGNMFSGKDGKPPKTDEEPKG